ncbi:OLC1v1007703C2 [Oldenlandia corymbosa var. corymbosa]|uniref:Protein arginine methyltransferase NDUFAF7 n=1 Tax=Oldenlandia corymbosa var. corymbosa TaxID=529605 RepID=A0AAV1DMM5_OLDCO|nr:OLC1v1007703C2 [Oldenlandia corymbosa var. corymbosa]
MLLRRVAAQASAHYRRRLLTAATSSAPLPTSQLLRFFTSPCPPPFPDAESNSVEHLEDSNTTTAAKISIDRSGLYNPPEHSHGGSDSESELVKHLKGIIKFRGGPITVAEYMEEVLTNPKAGFYINRDVFGAQGDFITSPEVSQMFGEMVGVWIMCTWEQMGQPNKVNLVELGPGRGTLLADLLRGTSKFKNFTDSLHIHLVECSPALRKIQYQSLKCEGEDAGDEQGKGKHIVSTMTGSPVSWHSTLDEVPAGTPTIIIAHEFYDALPVHQFQRASHGWCEKMVDVTENSSFQFVLSPRPTPATLYLMKRCKWAEAGEFSKLDQIEICPRAMDLTQIIAKRIGADGGAALIIDYGLNGIVSDSLQFTPEFFHKRCNRIA